MGSIILRYMNQETMDVDNDFVVGVGGDDTGLELYMEFYYYLLLF